MGILGAFNAPVKAVLSLAWPQILDGLHRSGPGNQLAGLGPLDQFGQTLRQLNGMEGVGLVGVRTLV